MVCLSNLVCITYDGDHAIFHVKASRGSVRPLQTAVPPLVSGTSLQDMEAGEEKDGVLCCGFSRQNKLPRDGTPCLAMWTKGILVWVRRKFVPPIYPACSTSICHPTLAETLSTIL